MRILEREIKKKHQNTSNITYLVEKAGGLLIFHALWQALWLEQLPVIWFYLLAYLQGPKMASRLPLRIGFLPSAIKKKSTFNTTKNGVFQDLPPKNGTLLRNSLVCVS